MSALIIAAHPNMSQSVINKRFIKELRRYPDRYTVHELTANYPEGKIDIVREQQLVEAHDSLILQFPIQWFSCPPILKTWLDDVLMQGWAYGRNGGDKLKGKKVALAVTAGIRSKDYSAAGRYHYTLEQLLTPFEVTFQYYCHADYRPFFAYYGTEIIPGEPYSSSEMEIEKGAVAYIGFLEQMRRT